MTNLALSMYVYLFKGPMVIFNYWLWLFVFYFVCIPAHSVICGKLNKDNEFQMNAGESKYWTHKYEYGD